MYTHTVTVQLIDSTRVVHSRRNRRGLKSTVTGTRFGDGPVAVGLQQLPRIFVDRGLVHERPPRSHFERGELSTGCWRQCVNISTTTSTNSPSASIAADQRPAG